MMDFRRSHEYQVDGRPAYYSAGRGEEGRRIISKKRKKE